ncbi:MAG: nuclear transport factor 2 family protein [Ilumatobacteraceae bacterium]
MTSEHLAVTAVKAHVDTWNSMDRARWVALFSPDVVFEDPVGASPKVGIDAVHKTWDRSFTPGRRWTLHPRQIVAGGDAEAAVVMHNVGELGDKRVEVNSVEIFTVGHDGRIERVRAFFDQPTEFALADWFTPERSE